MNDWVTVFRDFPSYQLPSDGDSNSVTYISYGVDTPAHITYPQNMVNMPKVKSVIFNRKATIVYFEDGTKCIVRKSDHDEYNREHAVVYAIVKRAYGTVNEDGVVEGNGMGNMLAKVVANGYDQEAHDKAEKAKKANKNDWFNSCKNCQDHSYDKQGRDKYGRFTKKANRK